MNDATTIDPPAGVTPAIRPVDLGTTAHVHVIGIGGAGMSAIATVLLALGHDVTGSDLKDSATITTLRALGAEVSIGHAAEAIDALTVAAKASGRHIVVARSTAVPDHNVEVVASMDQELLVHSRAEILTAITDLRRCVAVAGTHGKTTTSSMLAATLRAVGVAPSFIIGGEVNEIGSGAVWDTGDLLIAEADESDGTFLALQSDAAIVTSADPDHLDLYKTADNVQQAFASFLSNVSGPRIVCIDDPAALAVANRIACTTYGTSSEAEWQIRNFVQNRSGGQFVLRHESGEHPVQVAAPGIHNARNASAAVIMAAQLGVDLQEAIAGLRRYSGVARRFEYRGEVSGVTFVDDYAHLPAEVAVTVDAAVAGGWDRVIAVFQPHRYTRTSALGDTFGGAFDGVDSLAVTSIYTAGEAAIPGVTGKLVADAVVAEADAPPVVWLPHRSDLVEWLLSELRPGDLCLTLGAGDLTALPDELLARLGSQR